MKALPLLALLLALPAFAAEPGQRSADTCITDPAVAFVCDQEQIGARLDSLWTAFKIKSGNPSKMGQRPVFVFSLGASTRAPESIRDAAGRVAINATNEDMVRFLGMEEGFISCLVIREMLFVHGHRVGKLTDAIENSMRGKLPSCRE